MSYYDLSVNWRAVLMAALFVAVCFSTVCFLPILKKRRLAPKLLLPVCTLVCGAYVTLFATETRVFKFSRALPTYVQKTCEMPIILPVLFLVLSLAYTAYVLARELRDAKTALTRASVKESLDKLPTGLCFYRENGRTVLVNHSMNELCHKIVGRDLQNAKLFWEILTGGETVQSAERLSFGEHPAFRLADGSVWTFSRTELEGIIQLVASDTTELSNVNLQLEAGNAELAAGNARMREYGARADELARSRERIDIKANIHRELGQALLITRKYVLDTADDANAPISIWKKNVAILTRESEFTNAETPLWSFLDSARASGVEVIFTGELPTEAKQNGLCVTAAVECLVNAVRHADAKTLYITVSETEDEVSVTYENDGTPPSGDIREGGGLTSLRHRSKLLGGTMVVRHSPRFALIITLPKKGENRK